MDENVHFRATFVGSSQSRYNLDLSEHVQNLPMLGVEIHSADPTTIADLRKKSPADRNAWSREVWGLAWHSKTKFPGLAYCLGGRSVFWGGWSPRLLEEEMPRQGSHPNLWPPDVVADLDQRYFEEASDQIGATATNDFIYGPLHEALRQILFDGLRSVAEAVPLGELPDHPAVRFAKAPGPTDGELRSLLGLPARTPHSRADLLNILKLEAPLAVESRTEPGSFPNNKFSSVPLLTEAARLSWKESNNNDANKRLMVVPSCHVQKLNLTNGAVTSIETDLGRVDVRAGGRVIVALGTIESTRLALSSFQGTPTYGAIGRNLMAHLRSNITIRVPRASLGAAGLPPALHASALIVKGRHKGRSRVGTFHLQITASGGAAGIADSETQLFRKIPDLDQLEHLRKADDQYVAITIRAIGEMEPQNPSSTITLDPERDEFQSRRAFVAISPSAADLDLWAAMDKASDQVAQALANGGPFQVIARDQSVVAARPGDDLRAILPYDLSDRGRRDGLGTTHHETGTMWMGADRQRSVTDSHGRYWDASNAYFLGPCLFPTIGSPNPMLTGIALARRLSDHLLPAPPAAPHDGFSYLFDGTDSSFAQWRHVGGGQVTRVGRALVCEPGSDGMGLRYHPKPLADFTLRLDFMLSRPRGPENDNSGVFIRFQDPRTPVPGQNDPNPAFNPVVTGFEVQIDEEARGDTRFGEPDGFAYNRTGAIYKITSLGDGPGQQNYQNRQVLEADRWNQMEIEARGNEYRVLINGLPSTTFRNNDPKRGQSPGLIGLQVHTGHVAFANIRVKG